MSYRHMDAITPVRLPVSDKAVLTWLARHANDDGLTFPTQKTLAIETCLSVRQVGRILPKLMAAGLITKAGHRAHGQDVYHIELPTDRTHDVLSGTQSDRTSGVLSENSRSDISGGQIGHSAPPDRTFEGSRSDTRCRTKDERQLEKGEGSGDPPLADSVSMPLEMEGKPALRALLVELKATFDMGNKDLFPEWVSATAGMTQVEIRSMAARVTGNLTPNNFTSAIRRGAAVQIGVSSQVLNVRSWLMERTGLSEVFVSNTEIISALRTYGPDSLLGLATLAKKDGQLTRDLFGWWFKGRESQYGGWDGFRPQRPLPAPLNDEQIAQLLEGVAS